MTYRPTLLNEFAIQFQLSAEQAMAEDATEAGLRAVFTALLLGEEPIDAVLRRALSDSHAGATAERAT